MYRCRSVIGNVFSNTKTICLRMQLVRTNVNIITFNAYLRTQLTKITFAQLFLKRYIV